MIHRKLILLHPRLKSYLWKCFHFPVNLWHIYRKATAKVNQAPIFVFGNQKSGTTVIAALLSKTARKPLTSDIFYRIELPAEKMLLQKEITIRDFVKKNKFYFSTNIIKEPGLIFFYDQLVEYFPKAKFIFILRDPRDNIRSIFNRLQIPGDLKDLGKKRFEALPDATWKMIMDGELFGVKGNNYIETQANRWNLALKIYKENAVNIELIRYEDFVKDKAGEITKLATRVGLKPVCDIAEYVDIQYQPRGDRNITWHEFFGSENLHLIETICRNGIENFSYL